MSLIFSGGYLAPNDTIIVTEGETYLVSCAVLARPEAAVSMNTTYTSFNELSQNASVTASESSPLLTNTTAILEAQFQRNPSGASTGTIECAAVNELGSTSVFAFFDVYGERFKRFVFPRSLYLSLSILRGGGTAPLDLIFEDFVYLLKK